MSKYVIQSVYNRFLRPYLPRTWGVYRGVAARDVRLLDLHTHFPEYKEGFLSSIEEYAPSREIELVGFGRGVSTTVALEAGAQHVTAYEASPEMIQRGRETLRANRCDEERVSIVHGLVGTAKNVYGDMGDPEILNPNDLQGADCLVLDCEGAEVGILEELNTTPEVIIVESHPFNGAPTGTVEHLLTDCGYNVDIREYVSDAPEGKHVLIGTAEDS